MARVGAGHSQPTHRSPPLPYPLPPRAEGLLQSDWHEANEPGASTARPRAPGTRRTNPTGLRPAPAPTRANSERPTARSVDSPAPIPRPAHGFMPREAASTARPAAAALLATPPAAPAPTARRAPAARPGRTRPDVRRKQPARQGRSGGLCGDLGARLDLPRIERTGPPGDRGSPGRFSRSPGAARLPLGGGGVRGGEAGWGRRARGHSHRAGGAVAGAVQPRHPPRTVLARGRDVLWLFLSIGVLVVAPASPTLGRLGRPSDGPPPHRARVGRMGTNQVAIVACLGAFAAGRLSMGQLARISRHGDATLRRRGRSAGRRGC